MNKLIAIYYIILLYINLKLSSVFSGFNYIFRRHIYFNCDIKLAEVIRSAVKSESFLEVVFMLA